MRFSSVSILLGLLFGFGLSSLMAAESPARPNILWLIAEDFGPHLSCYGCPDVKTPVLDGLAHAGMRYEHFFTTAPVCSPSRSGFMTGMYATTIGAQNHRSHRTAATANPLPEGVRVLTDWLRAAGYYTGNIVTLPKACGFKGTGKTDWNFTYQGKPFDTNAWEDLKSHQPFYAQINFHETHRNFNGEKLANLDKLTLRPFEPDHPVTRADSARYYDAAMELDRKIGLVLKQLETDGLADKTVVVFFGDNGESCYRGKQFCYEEGHWVPLLIRWPKAFPAPAQFQPGKTDARLLEAIDLAPTMLTIAQAAIPPKMEGRPFLGNQVGPPKEYVFGHRDRCDMTVMRLRTVRDKQYRYIRNFTPHVPFLARNEYKEKQYPVWNLLKELNAAGKLTPAQAVYCAPSQPSEELYDLTADPWETKNLAGDPAHQATLARLRGALEDWIKRTGDQGAKLETLEELQQAEARFDKALDWRPSPTP